MCKVSAKSIELQGSWSSSKFSYFQPKYLVSQKHWSFVQIFVWDFASLNQYYQIMIKLVHKKQFYFNHASHLKVQMVQAKVNLYFNLLVYTLMCIQKHTHHVITPRIFQHQKMMMNNILTRGGLNTMRFSTISIFREYIT